MKTEVERVRYYLNRVEGSIKVELYGLRYVKHRPRADERIQALILIRSILKEWLDDNNSQ